MTQYKKCATLSEVNNKFTEEVLKNILSETCNGKEVQLVEWSFNEGSAKGDNYLSNVYKGKVIGIINGNPKQNVQVNVVVKSMPKNPGTRKTLRCADFFCNEIAFYTQVRLQTIIIFFFCDIHSILVRKKLYYSLISNKPSNHLIIADCLQV